MPKSLESEPLSIDQRLLSEPKLGIERGPILLTLLNQLLCPSEGRLGGPELRIKLHRALQTH